MASSKTIHSRRLICTRGNVPSVLTRRTWPRWPPPLRITERIRSRISSLLSPQHVPKVLAVMATAGLYNDSGKWLFATGLPAKSGMGGGIIAVSPGKFGIAAISPPLDAAGAQKAITEISNALHGNPYAPEAALKSN